MNMTYIIIINILQDFIYSDKDVSSTRREWMTNGLEQSRNESKGCR